MIFKNTKPPTPPQDIPYRQFTQKKNPEKSSKRGDIIIAVVFAVAALSWLGTQFQIHRERQQLFQEVP